MTKPGQGSFEWSVMFAATAVLLPMTGLVGVAFALRARRLGSRRWLAALLAAGWCVLLGCLLRVRLGMAIVP
ncbi:MAG: hypothetical protein ACYDA2_07155 [Acidimicrobiales bacterium]